MLQPFALHRPATAEEASELLARHGDDASPYAGGTELLLLMKLGFAAPRHLVDLKRVAGFDGIDTSGPRVRIGALVTHRAVERSAAVRARCPLVADVARHVANVRVRNVGTVGGNLAFADPHSDLATLLLALDGRVELVSRRGRRELPIAEFVLGPWQTAREHDELLAAISFAPWPAGTAATYVKFGVHERPTLGVAVALQPDGARIESARVTFGCVNPQPTRVTAAEARLSGLALTDVADIAGNVATMAADLVDAVDDLHGSADYKREMVAVFTRRALGIAAARAMVAGARSAAPPVRYPYTVVA